LPMPRSSILGWEFWTMSNALGGSFGYLIGSVHGEE
jgi:hypothetical protein